MELNSATLQYLKKTFLLHALPLRVLEFTLNHLKLVLSFDFEWLQESFRGSKWAGETINLRARSIDVSEETISFRN